MDNSIEKLKEKAQEIRARVIEHHGKTKTSHLGPDLSSVEIMTALYHEIMNENDRFILSKGHSAKLLYLTLNDFGKLSNEIENLEEHPTICKKKGIWATTGSLGHGISTGIGMALAKPESKIYVLMGDGECDEGQVWEAARSASEIGVRNIIAIVDCNGFQGLKKTDYTRYKDRFESFGWNAVWCDGHNIEELLKSIKQESNKPLVVLAKTIKGKGVASIENQLKSHYAYSG